MRHEFPTAVKRDALERSGGRCEAVGARYGHAPGVRCQRAVAKGRVNYEHYPRGAHDPHPDTRSLKNCWAVCPECNQYAANHTDKQVEQRVKNLSYDNALHEARMARKAGLDVADPPKPRGRQGKRGPPIRSLGFRRGGPKQTIPNRPFPKRKS
jgi:hypothetical protein